MVDYLRDSHLKFHIINKLQHILDLIMTTEKNLLIWMSKIYLGYVEVKLLSLSYSIFLSTIDHTFLLKSLCIFRLVPSRSKITLDVTHSLCLFGDFSFRLCPPSPFYKKLLHFLPPVSIVPIVKFNFNDIHSLLLL